LLTGTLTIAITVVVIAIDIAIIVIIIVLLLLFCMVAQATAVPQLVFSSSFACLPGYQVLFSDKQDSFKILCTLVPQLYV